jgi:hypothetical protein
VGPLTVALALLGAPLASEAQASGKVWRVGVLTGSVPRLSAPFRALEQRLGELGYVGLSIPQSLALRADHVIQ